MVKIRGNERVYLWCRAAAGQLNVIMPTFSTDGKMVNIIIMNGGMDVLCRYYNIVNTEK